MELIVLGTLKPDDKIPSIRALAKDLSLNFNTVKKAFSDLEADGVIYSVVGKGSFVAQGAMENNQIQQRATDSLNTALRNARANGLTKESINELVDKVFVDFGKGEVTDD